MERKTFESGKFYIKIALSVPLTYDDNVYAHWIILEVTHLNNKGQDCLRFCKIDLELVHQLRAENLGLWLTWGEQPKQVLS